jgi:hypothetical protein
MALIRVYRYTSAKAFTVNFVLSYHAPGLTDSYLPYVLASFCASANMLQEPYLKASVSWPLRFTTPRGSQDVPSATARFYFFSAACRTLSQPAQTATDTFGMFLSGIENRGASVLQS